MRTPKNPFELSIETGSMTEWGAGSLVQIVPTIQSSRTAETVLDRKEAVSAGSFSAFPVSTDNNGLSGEFMASSLRIQKFRSWRLDFGTELTSRRSGIAC